LNILVTGSSGQLGSEIKDIVLSDGNLLMKHNFYFTKKDMLDITDKDDVEEFCIKNKITHIVNCAAYTAVDKAEDEKDLADSINHLSVENLAKISKKYNISFIHISTDYVFDGKSYLPYKECIKTNPNGIYGQTKLDGEKAIQRINPKNSIIIRTSWVYSSFGNNFVKTMLRLAKEKDSLNVIYDQVGTPTYARDLAKTILNIIFKIENDNVEIYHYSNEGVLSWYDFAKEIMKMAKLSCKIEPIETTDYITKAKRPYYSVLNKSKIKKEFNLVVPYWKDGLKECLEVLNEKR